MICHTCSFFTSSQKVDTRKVIMVIFVKEVNPSPDIKVIKLVSVKLFRHHHIFATKCRRVTTAIAFSRQTLLHARTPFDIQNVSFS